LQEKKTHLHQLGGYINQLYQYDFPTPLILEMFLGQTQISNA